LLNRNKHIATATSRLRSSRKISTLLACAISLFLSTTLSAQVINNNNAVISVSSNTVVVSGVLQNTANTVENEGTIELSSHFINQGTTDSDGLIRLAGDWTNTGTFNEGTGRVEFRGDSLQTISSTEFGGETYHSLLINKDSSSMINRINLNNNVAITDTLNLNFGIINTKLDPNNYILSLKHMDEDRLVYNEGSNSRVIGNFERGVGSDDKYKFPVGSDENYNPLHLDLLEDPNDGLVLSEFIKEDPGIVGLPIPDDSVEIYNVIDDGYWSMTSDGSFSSSSFNIDINGTGFTDTVIHEITRVIKRSALPLPDGGPWTVDGIHANAVNETVGNRHSLIGDISDNGNHFAFGIPRPRIFEHPIDTTVCDSTDATSSVYAHGARPLKYQWFVWVGPGPNDWDSLQNDATYSDVNTPTLLISPAIYLTMDGYQYRVLIEHRNGHTKWSDVAILHIDELPDASINPARDTLCSAGSTDFLITSHIPISSYELANISYGEVDSSSNILTGPDRIVQTLFNYSDAVDSVRYIATPTGAGLAQCVGHNGYAIALVNPNPRIQANRTPLDTLFCNNSEIIFDLSNLVTTTGIIQYNLDVFSDNIVDFNGYELPSSGRVPVEPGIDFTDTLSHTNADIIDISYSFQPFIYNAFGGTAGTSCYGDPEEIDTLTIKMVPVLSSIAQPDTSGTVGGNPIRCFGLSDGATDITVTGGDYRSDYTFVWKDSTGSVIDTRKNNPIDRLEGQPAGPYSYNIIDIIQCRDSGTFVLTQPDPLFGKDSVVQPLCKVGNNESGKIFMNVSGGIPGYTYAWRDNFTRIPPEPQGTQDLLGVPWGEYDYFLTDTNLCTFDTVFEIPETEALEAKYLPSRPSERYNISCAGASDGSLTAYTELLSAEHPVRYVWYNSSMDSISSDSTITGLSPGMYYAMVIDDNGCEDPEGLLEHNITEPDSIHFEKMNLPFSSGWDISCLGEDDGDIVLNYTGGNIDERKNTFVWSTLDGSGHVLGDSLQNDLTAGSYNVSITDFLLCSSDTTITLLEPDPFQIDIDTSEYLGTTPKNIECFGEDNGWIYVNNVTGGGTTDTAEYNYMWTPPSGFTLPNGASTEDQDDLIAGIYALEITDQIGCDTSLTVTLIQPDILRSDTLIDRGDVFPDKNGWAIQCFGGDNGVIELHPSGGNRAYSYEWTDLTRNAPITADTLAENLFMGTYSVIITDVNGCNTSYTFALNEPDTIKLNERINDIYCFGASDSINLYPGGGNDIDYTYSWEDGGTESFAIFEAGTYYVEVTDANNCTVNDSLSLVQNKEIIPTIAVTSTDLYNSWGTSCYGAEDAIVQVYIEPEQFTYTYNWSNGVTGSDFIENVGEGWYKVEGVDTHDCPYVDSILVESPTPLTLTIDPVDPICFDIPTGEIIVFPEGGQPFIMPGDDAYTFVWSDPLLTGNQLSELPEGEYELTLFDLNNCVVDTSIFLIYPDPLVLEYDTTNAECAEEGNGTITITDSYGGTWPYNITIDGEETTFIEAKPGIYPIVFEDAHGCLWEDDSATIGFERESCIYPPNAFTPNDDGSNDTWILDEDDDGTTDMIYYPEAELRIYNRWGVLVYYSNNVAGEPWDGTYNGRDMPIDSYHYILDLKNGDLPILGNVTIIR
jgi:gliding motility-associated-like protein